MRDIEIFNKLSYFLDNFKAPLTFKIYDYENDRATPINKHLFTEEKIIIKDLEKEKRVQEFEEKVHKQGKYVDDENRRLYEHTKYDFLDSFLKLRDVKENFEKEANANLSDISLKEGFANDIFKEIKYKNLKDLSNEDIEAYKNLGVSIENKINEQDLINLKQKLDDKTITLDEYKKMYKELEETSFNIEVSETYFEPLIKTFFNKIKPNALIKDLEWLDERFIFMPEDPRRRINDKEDSSLTIKDYRRNYKGYDDFLVRRGSDIQNYSVIEATTTSYFLNMDKMTKREYTYPQDRHKPKNGPDTDIEPIYNTNFPKDSIKLLLNGGVAHLFRDHPAYLLHLNHAYGEGKYIWTEFEKNRKYLATGYKPDSFSGNIFERSKELKLKDKAIIDIKNYEEIQNMNLSKDEKFDLFLKILYIIDSNPYKDKLTPQVYLHEVASDSIDFSKASKAGILEYFRLSNELNPTTETYSDGTLLKRRPKHDSNEALFVGVILDNDFLDMNKDFYLVHSLYNHVYKKFDFDREIQSKYLLKNYWDNLIKPYLNSEKSRNHFFYNVRFKVEEDLEYARKSSYNFFSSEKKELVDYVNSLFNKYSIDARNSDYFNANFRPEILADEIIEVVKKGILNNQYYTPRERKYETEDFGLNWENNKAVRQSDIEELLRKNDIKLHYISLIQNGINNLTNANKYQMANLGEQGKKIFDATILHALEKYSNVDVFPENINTINLFIKNTKIHLENMVKQFNDPNYLSREQPPYFPMIRHFIENWNLDLEKDDLHPLYQFISKDELIDKLGSNENFNSKLPTNKLFKLGFYNIEDKHINPLNNIAYQLMLKREKKFGQNIGRMDYLHKDFEFYKGKFNSNNRIRLSKKEVQTNEVNRLERYLKEYVDAKLENTSVENIIDKNKMIETMKTIVRMSKDFKNSDKIIDLSDINNISNELGKLDEKISGINDITKSGLILNYIFTMNALYKKNLIDSNEINVDILDIDKPKAMILQNLLENESSNENNHILKELKDKYIKESIILNENFSIHHDNSIKDKFEGLEVFNGKHFPLFIDLESLTIFSVEWTTRYPTLNVVTLPDVFAKLEIDNNITRKNELFNVETKTLNHKMDYINLIDKVKEIDNDLSSVENKEYYDYHTLNKLNIMDRVSTIFNTIQTNYFVQLEQTLDKSLFLDADPLYLGRETLNDGAIAFMNKYDFELFDTTNNEISKNNMIKLKDDIQYVDRYNFIGYDKYKEDDISKEFEDAKKGRAKHVYQENIDVETLMYKKINGYPSEKASKHLSKDYNKQEFNNDKKFIYDNQNQINIEDLPNKNPFLLKKDTLSNLRLGDNIKIDNKLSFKEYSINDLDNYKKGFLDLRLFETIEELEDYKLKHNSIFKKG